MLEVRIQKKTFPQKCCKIWRDFPHFPNQEPSAKAVCKLSVKCWKNETPIWFQSTTFGGFFLNQAYPNSWISTLMANDWQTTCTAQTFTITSLLRKIDTSTSRTRKLKVSMYLQSPSPKFSTHLRRYLCGAVIARRLGPFCHSQFCGKAN